LGARGASALSGELFGFFRYNSGDHFGGKEILSGISQQSGIARLVHAFSCHQPDSAQKRQEIIAKNRTGFRGNSKIAQADGSSLPR
jgi:hypothetical protein